MEKILIALNYDDTAQDVAEIGHRLAKAMNAETVLLHIVPEGSYYSSLKYSPIMGFDNFSSLDMVETDGANEANRIAQNFLSQYKARLGDDTIQTLVKSGDSSESILHTAYELKIGMIVMGTHHRSGIERIFAGSVAEKVLHHSSIPVLIIPGKSV